MKSVYSALKPFRFADRIAALAEGRPAAPIHVRIKPTNRCNHSCWYCAYRADDLQLGENMDLADTIPELKMFEIVDDLIAMDVKAVTFSGGGEPLLYKPLPEVVRRLATSGIQVATLTNGSNLRGSVADAFAKYGTWVRISMDGWDDESYAASRGVRGNAYSRIIDNLRAFIARQSACALGVSFIVTQNNVSHLYDVCALLKDIGVGHVKISAAVVSNDAAETARYHSAIAAEARSQIARARELADKAFTVLDHYHETAERFEKPYRTCPAARLLTVIGADCEIHACQDKAYTDSGRLGSFRERRFADIWYAPETQARLSRLDPSQDCRHHCVSHRKNMLLMDFLSQDLRHVAFV
jgi:MoaA/NifB/PqqE/SkfB family radical SAM enzyme